MRLSQIIFASFMLAASASLAQGQAIVTPAQPAAGAASAPTPSAGVITFQSSEYDFGTVTEGAMVATEFKFKNTGTEPFLILNVRPSCGCTAPDWTREPVPPGGTGIIRGQFNSQGKPGQQRKTLTVETNTATPYATLTFMGNVLQAPAAPGQAPTHNHHNHDHSHPHPHPH